jgi:hypothetical protein
MNWKTLDFGRSEPRISLVKRIEPRRIDTRLPRILIFPKESPEGQTPRSARTQSPRDAILRARRILDPSRSIIAR